MNSNSTFDPKSKLSVIARRAQVRDLDMLIEKCSILYQILTIANEQVNLTRIDSEEGFWIKHVADSLMLGVAFPDLTRQKLRVGDIGCGAGFPSSVACGRQLPCRGGSLRDGAGGRTIEDCPYVVLGVLGEGSLYEGNGVFLLDMGCSGQL